MNQAIAAYEQALAIGESLVQKNPNVTKYQIGLADNINNLGLLYRATGKPAEALAAFEKALALREHFVAQEKPRVKSHGSK